MSQDLGNLVLNSSSASQSLCDLEAFSGTVSTCQCRRLKRHGFDAWVWKIPWRRKWQPILVFLPEKSHGQRSLAGYSSWALKELAMTEQRPTPEHSTALYLNFSNIVYEIKLPIVTYSSYFQKCLHPKKITTHKIISPKEIYATEQKQIMLWSYLTYFYILAHFLGIGCLKRNTVIAISYILHIIQWLTFSVAQSNGHYI